MLRIFKSLLQLFTFHRLNLNYNCSRLCMISYSTLFSHVFIIVFALVLFLPFSLSSKYFRQWVKETFIGQSGNIINRFLKTNLQIHTWNTTSLWIEDVLKKAERRRIDAFELWCLRRLLRVPDCKEIQPGHPKGDQSWVFIGRTDAEAGTPILCPPDVKNWLIGKYPDAGKDWRQEEKGTT